MLNRLQRRLREDETATTDADDYSVLLTEFINDSYEEILDQHMWEALKHTVEVDVVDGTSVYELSALVANGGDIRNTGRALRTDSELQWLDSNVPEVFYFDDDADIDDNGIWYITPEQMRRRKAYDRTDTDIDSMFFTIYQGNDGTETKLYLEIYPEPDAPRVWQATFWTRPVEWEVDGTTDNLNILIPDRPVLALALMYASNERGEEIGEPGNLLERRANLTAATAIDKDIAAAQRGDRYDWKRD
jgi:hypothetical protein